MEGFRPNVAALVLDPEGKLLVCERLRFKGAWQFPQGGVDKGEDLETALKRELVEEIGLAEGLYRVNRSRGGYRYVFPEHLTSKKSWKFRGQEQTYFECLLNESRPELVLGGEEGEFRSFKWIEPSEFRLDWLPEFKREVYFEVMRDFFGVELH